MKRYNNNNLKRLLSILSLGVLLPYQADATMVMLKGDFDINGGQVDYQIPIQVAPGRAGHAPSFQLAYSSDNPNGIAGVGWQLQGMSSIYRCGKNLSIDGHWGGVNFDDDDRFCLDGKRLIAVTGKPGENATEYRTRNNDYRKIVSYGRLGNGPSYFKVWSKDGGVYEYGKSQDSRAELPGKISIYKWALSKSLDITKKNDISYEYTEDEKNGIHRLAAVRYTGGSVSIAYEGRKDPRFSYLAGSRINNNYRIKSITSRAQGGAEIATYKLAYTYSAGTGRSLITSVTQCVQGACSTPVSLGWQAREKPVFSGKAKIFPYDAKKTKLYDLERDGNIEIFALSKDQQTVVQNSDAKRKASGWKHINSSNKNAACYDFTVADWAANNAPYFRLFCYTPSSPGSYFAYPAGKGRYAEFYTGGAKAYPWARSDKYPIDKNGNGTYSIEPQCAGCTYHDINGDGKTDEYLKYSNGTLDYYKSGKKIQTVFKGNNRLLLVADFNNDGYQDLLASWRVSKAGTIDGEITNELKTYYFTGKEFQRIGDNLSVKYKTQLDRERYGCHGDTCYRYYHYFSPEETTVTDINADGLPDIVYADQAFINKGGIFSNTRQGTSGYSQLEIVRNTNSKGGVSIADVNSDGWPDNIDGANVKRSKPFAQDKINTIGEYGVSYVVSYAPLVSSVHKQEPYHQYPIVNTTPTKYVVSQYVTKPLGYDDVKTSFKYYGAKSHLRGEGFLGFKQIDRIRHGLNTEKTVTKFEQRDPILAGKIREQTTYRNDSRYVKTSYQYTRKEHKGFRAKYYSVTLNGKTQIAYDSRARIEKQTVSAYTYDAFGNILTQKDTLTSQLAGAGKVTRTAENAYLSRGTNKINTIINIDTSEKPSFFDDYDSFQVKCTPDGGKYVKPIDQFVLIHGDVSTPLITKRYREYYRLMTHPTTGANGVTVIDRAELIPVTAKEYNSVHNTSCGSLVVRDTNGDGKPELVNARKTVTSLITESGDNYWKVSAPTSTRQTVSEGNFTRTVANTFSYTPNGLLSSSVLKPQQYEAGDANLGNTSKQVVTSYTYDRFGNPLTEQVSGTGTGTTARTTTTVYDGDGLFPKSITNGEGHETRYEYDGRFGLVNRTVSPVKGRLTVFDYDGFGRLQNENPPGSKGKDNTAYQYRLGRACPESTARTTSCVIANMANGKGGVYTAVTHYDFAGREIRSMHQAFDGRWVYRDSRWDKDGRKVAVTRPSFKRPDTQINPLPTVYFGYDERDREISKTEPSANGQPVKSRTLYDGLETILIDAKGNKKRIYYNLLGHITATVEPLGASQTYVNYPDGKLRETRDAAGHVTEIRYDNLGNRTYLKDPDMGVWTYNYNVFSELTYKRDANGVETHIRYDSVGRKTAERQGNHTSSWVYDERKKGVGLLSYVTGHGSRREFYYNDLGQVKEVRINAKGQQLLTRYTYDGLERVATEIRPNGLKLEYLYNPYGYQAAVRSPKDYADDVFKSESFKGDVQKLVEAALAQARAYLAKAEEYAVKESFFKQQAGNYANREIDLHNLDSQSARLLKGANRYKKYCAANGECYLQAAAWVALHDDVTIPLDIDLKQYFKISSRRAGSAPGRVLFESTVHKISAQTFKSLGLTRPEEWLLRDYDRNGSLDLIDSDDVYAATVGGDVRKELIYTSEELSLAAEISATRYQYYYRLAEQLTSLAEQVGDLSGLYCDDANRLAGNHLTQRRHCTNNQRVSQADHLETVLTQIELGKAAEDDSYIFYWQRQSTDAYDHTLAETLGNGLVNSYVHNPATGRPNVIATHRASSVVSHRNHLNLKAGQNVRYLRYAYDANNNVTRRDDLELGISERFEYDALDRLKASVPMLDRADRHGPNNPDFNRRFSYDYDKLGNLENKTDIGSYQYGGAGPHAVSKANGITFTYDNVGNLLKGETGTTKKVVERSLEWSSFNKPTKITRNGHTVEFEYDANHQRYYRKDSTGKETLYFDKLYEQVKDLKTGEVEHKQYIYADGKLIALNITQHDSADKPSDRQIRYLHYDALGSIDLITDGFGIIVERRSFDPWGKARKVQWDDESNASNLLQFTLTNRGFTGHEHLKEVGMIHMNGRVYDEELGRFLSADPIIQSPYRTNSFNRYSYVMNNPMKYIDPTGHMFGESCDVNTGDAGESGEDSKKGCNNGKQNGALNRRNSKNDGSESTETVDDVGYQQYRGGKFVADDEQEFEGYVNRNGKYRPGIIDGRVETIELAEDVEQSLNVTTEVQANQPRHNTEFTDSVSEVAQGIATVTLGAIGQLTVNGTVTVIKANQTVKVDVVTTITRTYDVYSQKAKHFSSTNETHITGERVKTGRRVSYTTEIDREEETRNVRDAGPQPSVTNASISPPSKYQGIISKW
ncbi:hypothetical protein BIT28_23910 [Photobacterium proteolyticum]|uniref:Insecticide toxin TcdB middle/N-terminal domain-containing protein n=1 Tax=Photobacterium proteolyticum TaxID=1903952 RepID=A0A1Q9GBJ4_9GAMM|nr:RHS repeat-associated core domain-containing protein [Photobacterium proteolyticum]OLQ71712.1 hypothetical protein BIT28_23910 [Photobacterium proteolyticum]